ncbi:MAG: nucleotidyltransferase substrate binding protein [Deltaproteobacteria bacterium]|nr:nucleotidyltransferase substrate binding protein [Deltaproteobacteria bacterium]
MISSSLQDQIQKRNSQVKKGLQDLFDSFDATQKIKNQNSQEFQIHFDASIKRFEVLMEYSWKLLKIAAEYQGLEAPGPRPAIQEGIHLGWITDPELWADALSARNGSVHDYFQISKTDYLELIENFMDSLSNTLDNIEKDLDFLTAK